MKRPRTVHDFKLFIEREAGGSFPTHSKKGARTDAEVAFWDKLNRRGASNILTQPPETVFNIDATVELPDAEWNALTTEFRAIMAM